MLNLLGLTLYLYGLPQAYLVNNQGGMRETDDYVKGEVITSQCTVIFQSD